MLSKKSFHKIVFVAIFLLVVSPSLWLDQFVIYFFPSTGFPLWQHMMFFLFFTALTGLNLMKLLGFSSRRIRNDYLLGGNLLALVVLFTAFHANPVGFSQLLGAPALLQFFISCCVALTVVLTRLGKTATFVVALLLIIRLAFGEIDHPFDVAKAEPNQHWSNADHSELANCQFPTAQCAFQDWLRNRPDLGAYAAKGLPYPVFLISAEGGGIYAAAHTFATLEHASLACPNFRQHVFAISAVSGGAMGTAMFVADDRFSESVEEIHDCVEVDAQTPARAMDLSEDYFSTVLGGFIFGNIVQFLVPFDIGAPSSGEFLETAFLQQDKSGALSQPVREYWRPEANDPAVFLNTTNVGTGRTELIAPFPLDRHLFAGQGNIPDRIQYYWFDYPVSIVTGASLAARFPFITPTGKVPDTHSTLGERYADGGYYENTGAAASLAIHRDIREQEWLGSDWCISENSWQCGNYADVTYGCVFDVPEINSRDTVNAELEVRDLLCSEELWAEDIIPVSFVHIPIFADYTNSENNVETGRQSFFDPIITLLATRVSRGRDAIIDLEVEGCGYSGKACHGIEPFDEKVQRFEVSATSLGLPLGWSLGLQGYSELLNAVANNFNNDVSVQDCDEPSDENFMCRYPLTSKQSAIEYALTGVEP